MHFIKIKSYAKINLSLNINGKLKSKYHKIESLVSFINLYDAIYLREIKSKKHKVYFKGKFANGITAFLFRKYQFALSKYAVVRMELAPIRNERLSIRFIPLTILFGSICVITLLNFWMRGESKTT